MKKLLLMNLMAIGFAFFCLQTVEGAKIYFQPGKAAAANAAFRLHQFADGKTDVWVDFSSSSDGLLEATITEGYSTMQICRVDPSNKETVWTWGDNLTYSSTNPYYFFTGYNSDKMSYSAKALYRRVYVHAESAPHFHCWNGTVSEEWPGRVMTQTTVNGSNKWYVYAAPAESFNAQCNTGDNSHEAAFNVSLTEEDAYYYYYSDHGLIASTVKKTISGSNAGSNLGYATFGSTSATYWDNADLPENVTVYKSKVSGSTVTNTAFTGDLHAQQGLLLKNETGSDITLRIPVATSAPSSTDNQNDLVAVTSNATLYQPANGNTYYILTNQTATNNNAELGWYKVNSTDGNNVLAGTAYLQVSGSGARAFYPLWDEATAIDNLDVEEKVDAAIYNIAGQRVSQPVKGLYIVNGKKFYVK